MPDTAPIPQDLVNALAGTYELIQEVGRGGMGVVYAGRDVRLDRLVAIKVLPELVSSADIRERFLREARASARLSHPSIVPIYAADERGGVTFLVMAYVDGATLSAQMRNGASLSPDDAVPVLRDIAQALNLAHQKGVVHRDIKPENVLIDRATGRAMVTDFGIARLADALQSGALTRTGQVLGTVGYMSPEQVMGADVDGRSDLYSLGVLAFEALSGRLPFDGPAPVVIVAHATKKAPPLASVAPQVPPALCAVVDRCLMKDPADRYPTGAALASALEQAAGRSVATGQTSIARVGEDRVLTEKEAERVWERAAELQAGIAPAVPRRAPTAAATIVPRTATNGFRLEHVREAAIEAGISAAYVTLALDELLRRGDKLPSVALAARGREASPELPALPAQPVTSLSPAAPALMGAPASLVYEAEVEGQLSPNDFDVVAYTIRTVLGEGGIGTALGRTLSWNSAAGQHQRQVHVSIAASGGRTRIRVEERMRNFAGSVFGGIIGGGGFGFGGSISGMVMGATHSGPAALGALGCMLVTAYGIARTVYGRTTKTRASQLEGLTEQLADQISRLIAEDSRPRALNR